MTSALVPGRPRVARLGRKSWKPLFLWLSHILLVLLISSFATFALMSLVPGNPAYTILGDGAAPAQVAAVDHQLGLDHPLIIRYIDWLGGALHGNLGNTLGTQTSVSSTIASHLPVTLEIMLLTIILSIIISIPLGAYLALKQGGILDRIMVAGSSMGVSIPPFVVGLLLAYVFGLKLHWFPVVGWSYLSNGLIENLRSAWLPASTLAVGETAILTRVLRADMIAILESDFITAAKSRGLSTSYIVIRHALRPSSISFVTLTGLSIGQLIGGAVIVESLFSLPGVGQLLIQSILSKDYVTVQGIVLFIAVSYVLLNVAVDEIYKLLDPRLKA
jgi:peptide/nickel transport system permease protein